MSRKWPVIPTIVVLAAAAAMVALGVWQLQRAQWKEHLIDRAEQALAQDQALSSFPANGAHNDWFLYRRLEFECANVLGWRSVAGRNARGQVGYVHVAQCDEPNLFGFDSELAYEAEIVTGWSQGPDQPEWHGGSVRGTIVPGDGQTLRVVANPPLAGLEANAAPDPNDLPNNHLAYAFQWFFFAITALVIYWLALRRRWRDAGKR
jgi:surfeit locus 1 family protein